MQLLLIVLNKYIMIIILKNEILVQIKKILNYYCYFYDVPKFEIKP